MEERKVWYACYGSNLLEERFRCYISGGQPKGANRLYPGCTNKTFPTHTKPLTINREMYFAKISKTWNGGGAAFIRSEVNKDVKTLGRMYHITRQQFIDLVQQEIKFEGNFNIDLEKVIEEGSLNMRNDSWYGQIIYLGDDQGHPIFTFTNEEYLENDINAPNEHYLKIIIEGLKQTYKLAPSEIQKYLENKTGIKDTFIEKELPELIGN